MNIAYITLITNENYLNGALTLAQSVKNTKTEIPFFVLIPENISESVIKRLDSNKVKYIKFSDPQTEQVDTDHYWKDTMTKLRLFDLTEFDKIVFLDADAIVFKNIDFLFEKPHMSAVAAGKELHPDWVHLNSGLMVIEPDSEHYNAMVSLIEEAHEECIKAGRPFGDQDVISKFYSDWHKNESLHLHSAFNVLLGYAGILKKAKVIDDFSDIYFYHFTGKQKPWGSLKDRIIVLLKLLRRSPVRSIDLKAYMEYRKILKSLS